MTLAAGLGAAGNADAQTRELGSSGELLDGIAALADTGVVLKSELARRLEVEVQAYIQRETQFPPEERSPLPPLAAFEQTVLDRLIIEELQVQRALRAGIVIGDDIVNEMLVEVAGRNGITIEQLPAVLASEGIGYAEFREDQRRSLMIETLVRNDVMARIAISPRELEQCLERTEALQFDYDISHILISYSGGADQAEISDAQARAREVVRQLDEGADFAQLAAAYSDSQTALTGGELGWRKRAELPSYFAADVIAMESGEHSTPIRAGSGFHIVRLNDLRGAEPEIVDQVRVRHILLRTNEILDDDATMQKLAGIRNQILEGEEFATVAQAQSADTGSAIDGGDLGWDTLDAYDEVFAGVLESLEVGELSEPFRTPFGWHIAEVTGRRSHDVSDENRELNCRNQIGQGKLVEERELWEQRIRDEAFVVKRL
jgi:peptidyl-prolyl cis-trans isomerase SurA